MRLTREKIIRLSHQITDVLVESAEVEFVDDRDTIRQQVVQILTATLKEEEKIELEVRKRITSQKKEILEGSEEWDVLHKKYYQDELRRMGIAAAPTTATGRDVFEVIVSPQLSVVSERGSERAAGDKRRSPGSLKTRRLPRFCRNFHTMKVLL